MAIALPLPAAHGRGRAYRTHTCIRRIPVAWGPTGPDKDTPTRGARPPRPHLDRRDPRRLALPRRLRYRGRALGGAEVLRGLRSGAPARSCGAATFSPLTLLLRSAGTPPPSSAPSPVSPPGSTVGEGFISGGSERPLAGEGMGEEQGGELTCQSRPWLPVKSSHPQALPHFLAL